ncbi:MAG TPA: TOBE domain-containing protein, partial [Chloroflexota bacterium]
MHRALLQYRVEVMNMRSSARNRLPGTVRSVKLGGIMAQIDIEVGDHRVTGVITREAAEELELKEGDSVVAVIKATE